MEGIMVGSILSASLLGSLHCAGMCGGLVTFYTGQHAQQRPGARAWPLHLAYNLGRLTIYAGLGALAGALGAGLNLAGALLEWQNLATLLAGAWMILWGVHALARHFGWGMRLPNPLLLIQPRLVPVMRRLNARPGPRSAFGLGLLSGFLPCGWLYLFVGAAAGAGGALAGATMMTLFWLGTVPALVSLGLLLQRLSGSLRRYLPAAAALVLIAAGAYTLSIRSLGARAEAASFTRGANSGSLEQAADGAPACHSPEHSP